jgi:hypothetical protein
MKVSRRIAVTAAALLALSTITAGAGPLAPPAHHHGHTNATAVWIIFGCAGSIIFAAWAKNVRLHRELTQQEAMTCGLGYWFNAQNYSTAR